MQVWQQLLASYSNYLTFATITSLPKLSFRFRTLILTMRDIYINSSLNSLTKLTSSSRSTELRYPIMEHLSNDYKERPNQHENSHRLCEETEHPVLSLSQGQWKLRQQHDQNFPMEGKPL